MEPFTVKMDVSVEHMQNLFGKMDENIRKIEEDMDVTIVDRDGSVKITGEKRHAERAARLIRDLLAMSERGSELDEQRVG